MELKAVVAPAPYQKGAELLMVEARPETLVAEERSPMHLCVVIDRSSSMTGRPLSLVGRAVQILSARLQAGDYLALILFDETAEEVLPMTRLDGSDLEGLEEWIGPIRVGQGTDLEGALVLAARSFEGQYVRGAQRRVLLISDGFPSQGATQIGQFRNLGHRLMEDQGVSISTVAMGEEANHAILESLVGPGSGNFYAVHDSGGLAGALAAELDAARSAIAMSAELYVEVGPGLKSLRLLQSYSNAPHAEGLVVHLGPIAAGVPRVILGRIESDRSQRMGSVKLFWQGLAGKEAAIAPIEWVDEMDEVAARQLRREMGLLHMITAEEHYWRWQERDPARARGYLAKAREWLQTLASENLLPADLLNLHRVRLSDTSDRLEIGVGMSGQFAISRQPRALPAPGVDSEH